MSSKKQLKKSKTYERFEKFLHNVRNAKTDTEILNAGWELLDSYHGFQFWHRAMYAKDVINLLNEEKHEHKSIVH